MVNTPRPRDAVTCLLPCHNNLAPCLPMTPQAKQNAVLQRKIADANAARKKLREMQLGRKDKDAAAAAAAAAAASEGASGGRANAQVRWTREAEVQDPVGCLWTRSQVHLLHKETVTTCTHITSMHAPTLRPAANSQPQPILTTPSYVTLAYARAHAGRPHGAAAQRGRAVAAQREGAARLGGAGA